MAQEIINIGSAENDKTGDPLRTCFDKSNLNFTELYESLQNGNNTVYLYSEADLPNKTATNWTMDPNVPYKLAGSFSTNLQGVPSSGASLRGDNVGGYILSFTGTSMAMFKATDVDFYISNIAIDPGITNTAFEFNDTIGSKHRFIAETVGVKNCAVWGKFTDMLLVQVVNCNGGSGGNCLQGIQMFGTSGTIIDVEKMAFNSASDTFIGINLGSAVLPVQNYTRPIMTAPAGAFAFSGLVGNGNVTAGTQAIVTGTELFGGISDLQNISIDDVRWVFRDNPSIQDTLPDALIYISASGTTIIPSGGTYVKVNATWSTETSSQFVVDGTGRITWAGEKPIKIPFDLSISMAPAAGTNKILRSRITRNGTTIAASERSTRTDNGDASSVTTPWQLTMQPGEYIEAYVTSDDGTNVETPTGIARAN